MWSSCLLSFWRNLARRPLYGALNVLGLAVGLAAFLVLFLVVRFETSYDRWVPNADAIYRLNARFSPPGMAPLSSALTAAGVLPVLKSDYPQIAAGVQLTPETTALGIGQRLESQEVSLVHGDFFGVFGLPLVAGDPASAFAPGGAVFTESLARRYFGTTAALGRTFTVDNDGAPETHRVTGVLKDPPANTSLKLEVLLPLPSSVLARPGYFDNWFGVSQYTYVRFRTAAEAPRVLGDLQRFVSRRAPRTQLGGADPSLIMRLTLAPLRELHFVDSRQQYAPRPGADRRVVASLGLVGGLTLLIAALNYVNLASAQAVLRAREVAIRKVVGGRRSVLLAQFLLEATATVALAALIALALTELALPAVNALGGLGLRLYGAPDAMLALAAAVLLIGLGAGLYPSLVISRFAPAPVLASAKSPGGGRTGSRVRAVLVLLQFAAAIGFAVCTLVVGAQTRYLREADRGFDRQGLIVVDSAQAPQLAARQGALLAGFARVPGVAGVTRADLEPATENIRVQSVARPGQKNDPPTMAHYYVGDRFFEVYGIRPLAGRLFEAARREDDLAGDRALKGRTVNMVVNAAATRALHFSSPAAAVGQMVRTGREDGGEGDAVIVGVIGDVRFMSPQQPVMPTFYLFDTRRIDNGVITIRYAGADAGEMMDRLRGAWSRIAPDVPFQAATADGKLSDYFVQDERRARLFGMGAFVAVALGCVGLFGLASFTTTRRTKEIGVRKALGASTADVLRLLVGQFLRPVLLANLIACPLAWLVLRAWLAGFDQRIALDPGYFLLVALGAVALAVGTVADQAFRVARTEPARALRYE